MSDKKSNFKRRKKFDGTSVFSSIKTSVYTVNNQRSANHTVTLSFFSRKIHCHIWFLIVTDLTAVMNFIVSEEYRMQSPLSEILDFKGQKQSRSGTVYLMQIHMYNAYKYP